MAQQVPVTLPMEVPLGVIKVKKKVRPGPPFVYKEIETSQRQLSFTRRPFFAKKEDQVVLELEYEEALEEDTVDTPLDPLLLIKAAQAEEEKIAPDEEFQEATPSPAWKRSLCVATEGLPTDIWKSIQDLSPSEWDKNDEIPGNGVLQRLQCHRLRSASNKSTGQNTPSTEAPTLSDSGLSTVENSPARPSIHPLREEIEVIPERSEEPIYTSYNPGVVDEEGVEVIARPQLLVRSTTVASEDDPEIFLTKFHRVDFQYQENCMNDDATVVSAITDCTVYGPMGNQTLKRLFQKF